MRSCEDFEALLPAYVAGIVNPGDAQEIGEHIAECSPCLNDYQGVVRDLGSLKFWRESSLPEGLSARILERIVAISEEEARREPAAAEEGGWGEPVQRALTVTGLTLVIVVVAAMLVTASRYARHYDALKACQENLRTIGIAASAAGELRAPLEPRLKALPKPLNPEAFLCPVAGAPPPGRETSYRLDLPGPRYLAGDWRTNHGEREANILMSDGSVILVTPSQPSLWEVLDPLGPAR